MDDIYSLSDIQIQKKIGEKLKAVRLKQNITQDSLAELSSISRFVSAEDRKWRNQIF